ncbi:hypothetical protein BDF20DRAFT_841706 [Mycotypha africana]|uniref:uncharacterized protein n=1 Tax=Mycotypha africana TaxID=64632 RepID=UPI00230129B7|nr:uncharacterized protein BDF20DRAFT_841706 [Mycotypha africana]KAI8990932.1 hypothetical protein BDF20DRAFT_841706 [Mycotypha africana]
MKACICIDYLSHEWTTNDLLETFKGLNKQCSKTKFSLATKDLSCRQRRKLNVERNKQLRYQNAVWRQMARYCTKRLGYSNSMVSPSSVNWQKESDITWLYGPLYITTHTNTAEPHEPSSDDIRKLTSSSKASSYNNNLHSTTKVKSILKRNRLSTSIYRYGSDKSPFERVDYWNHRYWSKCASDTGKQSTVRFSSEIIEISYLPENPVDKSLNEHYSYEYRTYDNDDNENENYSSGDGNDDDDDDSDDEEFWKLMVLVGQYVKERIAQQQSTARIKNYLLVQCCISLLSATTWLMYQACYYLMFKSLQVVHQAAKTTLKMSKQKAIIIKATTKPTSAVSTSTIKRNYTTIRRQSNTTDHNTYNNNRTKKITSFKEQ